MSVLPEKMTVFLLLGCLGVQSLPAFADTTRSPGTFKKDQSLLKNATIENVHQTPSDRHRRDPVQGIISTQTTLYAGSPLNDPEATFYHLEQEFFKDDPANQKWLGEYPHSAEVRLGLRAYHIMENASLFVSAGYGVLKSFREQPYDTGTLRLKRNLPFVVLAGRSVIPARDFVRPSWLRGLNFFLDIAYYLPLLGGTVTLESATYKREYREERPVLNLSNLNASSGLEKYWGSHWSSEFALGLGVNAVFVRLGIAYLWGGGDDSKSS